MLHVELNWLLRLCDVFQLDYCCSPRSLESVEDRDNYTFIRVRAEKLDRTLTCVPWQHFKPASPSTGRCVQPTTGKLHFQHRTDRRHLSPRCQNSRWWVAAEPRRRLAAFAPAGLVSFSVFISTRVVLPVPFQLPARQCGWNQGAAGSCPPGPTSASALHLREHRWGVWGQRGPGGPAEGIYPTGWWTSVIRFTGCFYCADLWWEQPAEAVQSLFCH